jgi:hypothetical protein
LETDSSLISSLYLDDVQITVTSSATPMPQEQKLYLPLTQR